MVKAVFLDAAGTLIHTAEPVGEGYARVARQFGLNLDPELVGKAFRQAWKSQPCPDYSLGPSTDGDRSWWRSLVDRVFLDCPINGGSSGALTEEIFEAIYSHYASADSWKLFPDVVPTLERLSQTGIPALVVSNFDPRLRRILQGLGIATYFEHIIISSEVGSYKPDGEIFERACKAVKYLPGQCLHVGDDPRADISGADSAGLATQLIDRPHLGLNSIFEHLDIRT